MRFVSTKSANYCPRQLAALADFGCIPPMISNDWSFAGLFLVIVCLAITGALYEMIDRWRDKRRFPERGHLVQVGSIRMNIDCSGQGSPTVMLESGSGSPSVDWLMVQLEVSKFARVCSYDRAGYGWSDSGPEAA